MSIKESKIDQYGLSDKVMELREVLSIHDTAKIINEKYLPEGAEPLSHMAIQRWEEKKGISVTDKRIKAANVFTPMVNTYDEMIGLKNKINKQIKRLTAKIELLEEQKEHDNIDRYIAYSTQLERAIARKQTILNDITKYQKQIANTENVRKALEILVDELKKESPEVYYRFIKRLQEQREIFDLLRGS